MRYSGRKWRTVMLVAMLLGVTGRGLEAAGVPLATDLHREGQQAEQVCVPLLLEFASAECEYCTLLEEEVLNPTLLNRDYDRRVLMRKLVIGHSRRLRDFDNTLINATELADRYRVFVTPTLLFVDSQGRELTERMIGVTTLEFYGGYLDQAMDASGDRLRELGLCR